MNAYQLSILEESIHKDLATIETAALHIRRTMDSDTETRFTLAMNIMCAVDAARNKLKDISLHLPVVGKVDAP